MKNILKTLKGLLGYSDLKKTESVPAEQYVGAVSFKITAQKEIDISCSIPELKNKQVKDIENIAKIYAEFLFYINEGFLKDDLINILQQDSNSDYHKTDDEKAKITLFIDNVLFNWAMSHVENKKRINKSGKNNQPLIRPSSVFSAS